VFAQPREVNFPPLRTSARVAGVTVIFAEFGQAEALAGLEALPRFVPQRTKLARQTRPPDAADRSHLAATVRKSYRHRLPDLASRNQDLAAYVEAIRALAHRRGLRFLDASPNRRAHRRGASGSRAMAVISRRQGNGFTRRSCRAIFS